MCWNCNFIFPYKLQKDKGMIFSVYYERHRMLILQFFFFLWDSYRRKDSWLNRSLQDFISRFSWDTLFSYSFVPICSEIKNLRFDPPTIRPSANFKTFLLILLVKKQTPIRTRISKQRDTYKDIHTQWIHRDTNTCTWNKNSKRSFIHSMSDIFYHIFVDAGKVKNG